MGPVEHPRARHPDPLAPLRRAHMRGGARPEADPFALAAARLIGRHDLDHQGSVVLPSITTVQEVPVLSVHGKADMHIAVLLTPRKFDHAGGRDAAPQNPQALRIPDVLEWVTIPAAVRISRGGNRPGGGARDEETDDDRPPAARRYRARSPLACTLCAQRLSPAMTELLEMMPVWLLAAGWSRRTRQAGASSGRSAAFPSEPMPSAATTPSGWSAFLGEPRNCTASATTWSLERRSPSRPVHSESRSLPLFRGPR
jgi:hypothetical protein